MLDPYFEPSCSFRAQLPNALNHPPFAGSSRVSNIYPRLHRIYPRLHRRDRFDQLPSTGVHLGAPEIHHLLTVEQPVDDRC